MESIEKHIEKDREILENPTISPQQRRHIESELEELEAYAENHKSDIEAGDHHDPTPLEMYCDVNPDADECRIYED
ncbi:carbon metabolic regulator [Synechococcus phage S-CAM9]|uniref:Carbon metabolic regulator n=1 Tax=Synechococcus phage S-CAM9 TaxID=1883369 RepID=A0A1D8KNG0_9CAUD|nr:carbon metabolic regulator [Synechococcus phage S-CAM9]AOV60161.1 carbon metabolic regulator [Synechococcus phage S-CAM9]AOV60389.1 carbon metabolic regulator [Synechococcus phage S-CAM9]AOV60617.1 carbon metabolic regulator [Synechococcus phage S-CAM9]